MEEVDGKMTGFSPRQITGYPAPTPELPKPIPELPVLDLLDHNFG
jgi:hypothetical protein